MLHGKAEWYVACTKYLYVQASERVGLQTLDQFVEGRKSKNAKAIFNHETMKKCKYKYRNQDYKYEHLTNPQIIKLELPSFYDINNELFGCITVESGYCLRLLQTLDRYLMKARFETIKASTILDIDFVNSDYSKKSYQWQYLQRCYFAENAIYSYYSAFEIILQLIWISKGFHKEYSDFKRERTFESAVNGCSLSKLTNKLKPHDDGRNLLNLFSFLPENEKEYVLLDDFKCVRDWCNGFKHHGTLRFEGEKEIDKPTIRFEPVQIPEFPSLANLSSDDFRYTYIDLDLEVLPELKKYHNAIISLAEKVIDSCHIKKDFRQS